MLRQECDPVSAVSQIENEGCRVRTSERDRMNNTVTPKLSSIVSPFMGLKLQFGQALVGAGHLCLAQLGLKGGVTTMGSPEVSPFFVVSPAGSGRVAGPRTQRPRVSKAHGGQVVSRQRTDCRLTRAPESPRASSASAVHPGSSKDLLGFKKEGHGRAAFLPSSGNGRF